jgi:hypothetical protein
MDSNTIHQRKFQDSESLNDDIPTSKVPADTPSTTLPPAIPYQYVAIIIPVTSIIGSTAGLFHKSGSSYFAQKRNLINVIFAKNAWGWTSFVFFAYIAIVYGKLLLVKQEDQEKNKNSGKSNNHQSSNLDSTRSDNSNSAINYDAILRATTRWVLATFYWLAIRSMFDGINVMTGGKCSTDGYFTQSSCRRTGGLWSQGFDISGHSFLLSHSILFLMEELSVYLNKPGAWTQASRYPAVRYSVIGVGTIVSIWWLMLLYTGVYHHEFLENLLGMTIGMAYWWGTYVNIFKTSEFPAMPEQSLKL